MPACPHAHPCPPSPGAPRQHGALAVITNDRGEILMHLRDEAENIAWPGYWAVPGGACEPGEDPRTAIVRELAEEAGLRVQDLSELCEVVDEHGSGHRLTVYHARYNGTVDELELTEGVKLQFFAPEHLDQLPVPPFLRRILTPHR